MPTPLSIQTFHFAHSTVQAYIPTIEWLRQQFETAKENHPPYWAQVWPAAKALCEVIAAEPNLVKDKIVLELAAGLGLPSLLAAQVARQVTATDYIKESVETMRLSVEYNKIKNMQCHVIDWKKPGKYPPAEILLLSDINYNPQDFEKLHQTLTHFILQGTTIILSTPHRLLAKPFMSRLLDYKKNESTIAVTQQSETVLVSVWILRQ